MSIHQTPERDTFIQEAKDPTLYMPKKVTVKSLKQFKNRQQPFAMLTAYDYSTAKLLDDAGIETLPVKAAAAKVMFG